MSGAPDAATVPGEPRRLVLIANPSADVYGADLQMLESVTALVDGGFDVLVTTPDDGPLVAQLHQRGASVEHLDYPVLRRAQANARGMGELGREACRSAVSLARFLRRRRPALVYVNTVTLPWWIVAGRLAGVPVTCHVHEAERQESLPVRMALYAPLLGAHAVLVNSRVTLETALATVPLLRRRARLVYNGVAGPEAQIAPPPPERDPFRLVLVGRLSPRKGVDVALDAVGLVRQAGLDVRLELCGAAFQGYEWFEEQLRQRAGQDDLKGAVTFRGYVDPVWPALERAHAVLATSLGESLGNAVIEAQLCARPVIATDVSGHDETVEHESTGLLVPVSDPEALARAITRLLRDPDLAERLGGRGLREAVRRFSISRYHAEVRCALGPVATKPRHVFT